jgi:hypothetical protein
MYFSPLRLRAVQGGVCHKLQQFEDATMHYDAAITILKVAFGEEVCA